MNRSTWRYLDDGDIGLWVPYDNRQEAKAIPGARWHPNLKCWRIPAFFRADAERVVTRLNGGNTSSASSARRGVESVSDIVINLLSVLPETIRTRTFRALAKAWHPDTGGTDELMQELNRVPAVNR